MKSLFYILLLLPLLGFSQNYEYRKQGDVFDSRKPDYVTKNGDTGVIVVTRTFSAIYFEDNQIPQAYKKMVEKFFNDIDRAEKFKKFDVKYTLNIKKDRYGDIYIENIKVGNIKDVPTSN